MNLPAPPCQTIQEQDDFLALFPHRYDYLWAEHPEPGERPDRKTESRHPLRDRLIQQGAYLYGVRVGKRTRYLLLVIDSGSLYHPARGPFASRRILAALDCCEWNLHVRELSQYQAQACGRHLPAQQEPAAARRITALEGGGHATN
jgi:hypothetical protein